MALFVTLPISVIFVDLEHLKYANRYHAYYPNSLQGSIPSVSYNCQWLSHANGGPCYTLRLWRVPVVASEY